MAGGTIASRILGLVRVVLAAYLLGTNSRQADILSLATTVPNSLYILFAGGALNTVLVPQLVRAVKNDRDGGEAYTNRIMTAFLMLTGVIAVVLTVAAPLVAWLYSDAAWHSADLRPQFQSMVLLTALCLPQVFFYGAFFLGGQVLNARDAFGPMMWAPIANNVVQVVMLGVYAGVWGFHTDTSQPFSTPQALVLGLGSLLGIATQTAVLVPFMRKVGFRYKPRFDLKGTGLGHTFHIAKWTLGFVAINQVVLLVVTKLGTSATAGGTGAGMTAYNNANLLWVLPHSLITVSLATAVLPSLSRMAAVDDLAGVQKELSKAIRLAAAALTPIALLYIAIGIPISEMAFRGPGKGGDLVGWTLVCFAVGLIPFTVQYLLLRAYYAFEDTRSTFFLQIAIGATNAILAVVGVKLVAPGPNWVAPMLALAYALAYVVGLTLSLRHFSRKLPGLHSGDLLVHLARLTLVSLPGTLLAAGLVWALKSLLVGLLWDLLGILLGLIVAGLSYLVLARVFRIEEVTEVVSMVARRLGRGRSGGSDSNSGTALPTGPDPAASADDSRDVAEVTDPNPAAFDGQPVPLAASAGPLTPAMAGAAVPEELADTGVPLGDPIADDPDEGDPADLSTGDILDARYRLEEKIATRGSTTTWRAVDQVLSRSVLVHALSPGNPRAHEILSVARQAARATDSRYLRVLDALEAPDVSYIVCEWSEGVPLENMLAAGPLSATESAWLVRELADALVPLHAGRLYHRRLNPDSVVVSNTGNVKIVGFMIDDALHPQSSRLQVDGEAADVTALGHLLYATLVQRWPDGPAFGLHEAPVDAAGRPLSPRRVRAGVSPQLDRIAQNILQPVGSGALTTAAAVAATLSDALGSVDASTDLANRVRYPLVVERTPVRQTASVSSASDSEITMVRSVVPPPQAAMPPTTSPHAGAVPTSGLDTPPDGPVVSRAVPPPPAAPRRRGLSWAVPLIGIVVVALIIGVVALLERKSATVTAGAPGAASSGAKAGTATNKATGPYPIAGAKDFDPSADGGNGEENPGQLTLAYDGKPDTAWKTLTYRGNAKLGGLKPGVGLIVDLGQPVEVGRVKLTLVGTGTTLDVRVPATAPETTDTAPMTSQTAWKTVGQVSQAPTTVEVALQAPVTTRFVLVYFTSLPAVSGGFQAGIAEVSVEP